MIYINDYYDHYLLDNEAHNLFPNPKSPYQKYGKYEHHTDELEFLPLHEYRYYPQYDFVFQ